jgi:hypothetical protein
MDETCKRMATIARNLRQILWALKALMLLTLFTAVCI